MTSGTKYTLTGLCDEILAELAVAERDDELMTRFQVTQIFTHRLEGQFREDAQTIRKATDPKLDHLRPIVCIHVLRWLKGIAKGLTGQSKLEYLLARGFVQDAIGNMEVRGRLYAEPDEERGLLDILWSCEPTAVIAGCKEWAQSRDLESSKADNIRHALNLLIRISCAPYWPTLVTPAEHLCADHLKESAWLARAAALFENVDRLHVEEGGTNTSLS